MSTPAPATPAPKKTFGKMILGGSLGLITGAVAMYSQAAFDRLVKPAKPLPNFQVSVEGLTVVCENRATGQSGFWDFGDGTALEPFEPAAPTAKHTYIKPGNYAVKLIVRNFLMDETDRSVNVEVTAPTPQSLVGNAVAVGGPQILNLKVETIRDEVPATIHITGKLENTDELIWKLGDKTEHIASTSPEIDRYVRIENEGKFNIVLTALSKSRKDPQVVVQAVEVRKNAADMYEAKVSVTDTITRTTSATTLVRLPVAIRDANGPTRGFSRIISASPNATILKIVADSSMPGTVKNFKVELAKDQKTATVSGEWAMAGDALSKAAGGSDVIIPVQVTEELRTLTSPGRHDVSGVMDATGTILVKLPPRPLGTAATRSVALDFGMTPKAGNRLRIVAGTLDANGAFVSAPIRVGDPAKNAVYAVNAVTLPDGSLKITFAPQANAVRKTP